MRHLIRDPKGKERLFTRNFFSFGYPNREGHPEDWRKEILGDEPPEDWRKMSHRRLEDDDLKTKCLVFKTCVCLKIRNPGYSISFRSSSNPLKSLLIISSCLSFDRVPWLPLFLLLPSTSVLTAR
ncbi:hypothetical protein M5K25_001861 [Dendrobium thyrsiflorum]|uniref:Uncharacterized protein n=1 Tax=Dendrobium thyrsiflorum TaxID=117978 RepID=A0ABD0VSZ6_DENTH